MNYLLQLLKKDQDSIKKYRERSIELDELRRINLSISKSFKEYIHKNGFPYKNTAGKDVYKAAIVLSLHSDMEFLKSIYELVAGKANEAVDKCDMAYITDKLLVFEGKPQLYGTQFSESTGKLFPIENEKELNRRRLEMGLEKVDMLKPKL